MHKLGSVLAFIFNKVFIVALVIVFMVAMPLVGVASTVTNRETVKSIITEADLYNTIPDNILDIVELEEDTGGQPEQPQASDEPGRTIRTALEENGVIDPDQLIATIKATLDAQFLQGQVEGVIDGVYDYLDETSSELVFELSLRDRADIAASQLRMFVSSSLADLPICGPADIPQDDDIEILDISCLPPGSNLETEINEFIDELTKEDGVLGEVYTQEDLDVSEVDLTGAQVVYRALSGAAFLSWLIIIGLSFAIVLTSKSLHRGFKEIGIIFGVLGALFLIAFSVVVSSLSLGEIAVESSDELTSAQEQAILNIAEPVAEAVLSEISSHAIVMSIVMIVLGAGSFVLGVYLTRHHVEHLTFHHQPEPDAHKNPVYPEATKGPSAAPTVGASTEKSKKTQAKKKPSKKTK